MITLWIKGSKEEAITAAERRGLVLHDVAPDGWAEHTATLDNNTANHMKVAAWYCEEADCGEDGYPVGTLLYYIFD